VLGLLFSKNAVTNMFSRKLFRKSHPTTSLVTNNSMARPQQKKKGNAKPFNTKGKGKKQQYSQNDAISKTLARDVFEAEEETGRRKGNDLDEVDNLEYDAGEIAEEDDSEIDSDEAFDESDEERFGGYKFSGSTKVYLAIYYYIPFFLLLTLFYSLRKRSN
jgi:hypothetical protein